MAVGARPGFLHLLRDFAERVQIVLIYVREAHPGERYPHHTSEEQKLRHACEWVKQDRIPWTTAVDTLDGATHRAYGPVPNSAYLIDRTGHVAFRALWAGQEPLLRSKIEELLRREAEAQGSVDLGQRENIVIPMIHGGAEFERTMKRAGQKARDDFRRAVGNVVYVAQKAMGAARGVINPGNRELG
jgi:hypothetical protein